MGFKGFVQVGRAVLVTTGPDAGKLGVIGMSLDIHADFTNYYLSRNHQ